MQRILVTGANRGIGFELTRQYIQAGKALVFAGCRAPDKAGALLALARQNPERLRVLRLDVNDAASIAAAAAQVRSAAGALDLLINNAGINPRGSHQSTRLGELSADDVSEVLTTNAVSALIVTQAFRELLQNGETPRVAMISSGMGSIERASAGSYAYRMSKAAMNMAARLLSQDAGMGDIITVTVNPGWVRTDMGGPEASLAPVESGENLLALFAGLSNTDNGKFFQYDGSELPW